MITKKQLKDRQDMLDRNLSDLSTDLKRQLEKFAQKIDYLERAISATEDSVKGLHSAINDEKARLDKYANESADNTTDTVLHYKALENDMESAFERIKKLEAKGGRNGKKQQAD